MFESLKKVWRQRYTNEPLISVEISRGRLLANLDAFRKLTPTGLVAPVLKSNAYGHGLIEVAEILESRNRHDRAHGGVGIPFFVVDSLFEAIALRAKGIKSHILIIGYTRPETILKSRGLNTAFCITSLESLKALVGSNADENDERDSRFSNLRIGLPFSGRSKMHTIHLKIDTGMHRQGLKLAEIPEAIELIERHPQIVLEGVCSHFSDADNADATFTEGQIKVWNEAIRQFRLAFPHIKYFHLSNTDGHVFAKDIDANVTRLGIGLYGLSGNDAIANKIDIRPVLKMKTILTGVKELHIGESAGYSRTFVAHHDMKVGTIPVGYYEGLDRRLSNIGCVLVGHTKAICPFIGRVSMNITIIDISSIKTPHIGQPVIVMSDEQSDPNSVSAIARACNTITYEIVAKIPAHLKRIVVD